MTCPHPEKIRYATRSVAVMAAQVMRREKGASVDLRSYPCGDHWHIGHDARHLRMRIRQALRSDR